MDSVSSPSSDIMVDNTQTRESRAWSRSSKFNTMLAQFEPPPVRSSLLSIANSEIADDAYDAEQYGIAGDAEQSEIAGDAEFLRIANDETSESSDDVEPHEGADDAGRQHHVGQHHAYVNTKPAHGAVTDSELREVFRLMCDEDFYCRDEALEAAREVQDVPLDSNDVVAANRVRRARPRLTARISRASTADKEPPVVSNNPLRGRLVTCISTSSILLFIFLQSLMLNYTRTGKFLVSSKANPLYGPSTDVLYALGGLEANAVRAGQYARLFWSIWMHAGWIHLAINLIPQIQFIYLCEPDWGIVRTFLTFWMSGITGNLMSSTLDGCSISVGSSGALMGLMGGTLIFFLERWRDTPHVKIVSISMVVIVIICFLVGLSGKGTDNWAHLGGLVGGICVALATTPELPVFKRTRPPTVVTPYTQFTGASGVKKRKVLTKKSTEKKKTFPEPGMAKVKFDNSLPLWIVRWTALAVLGAVWAIFFLMLFVYYEYKPPGQMTFSGLTDCCCCYAKSTDEKVIDNWKCYACETSNGNETWGEHCRSL